MQVIEPENSSVTFTGTKVEIKLRKAEPIQWKQLGVPVPKAKKEKERKKSDSDSDSDGS